MTRRFQLAAGLGAAGLLFLLAGAAPAAPDFSGGILPRDEVIAAARGLKAADYADSDDIVVDEFVRVDYAADGTDVTWDDEYIKVFTEKGKRARQHVELHFDVAYETAEVRRIELIKPDGAAVEVDVARQSRIAVDDSQMSANIYDPNSKVLEATVPGLEIGDVCHILSRRAVHKPRVPDTWSDYMVFEYTTPIRRLAYEVRGPRERPLRHKLLRDPVPGTVTATEEETAEGRRYRWDVREVPRMFPEPNMPPLYTVVQRLLVSTIDDWPAVSRWYWNLCKPRLEATTPDMAEKAKALVEGAGTRAAKIERLFQFVSQQIRYMGITTEKEAPGYEPHDVKTTFANRYGVCRDKAALLAAMLRLADVPAYPVIIHVGAKKDAEVPNPYFNHAVVAAEGEGGGYVLMDPTDENTAELFPAYLCNMSYLVAHPNGDPLRTSPIVPASNNLMRVRSTGSLDADGTLRVDSVLEFDGINDNAYRGYFAGVKPAERRRYFEGRIKDRIPGARVLDFALEPEDMMDTRTPLRARLSYEAPDFPVRGDAYAMLPLPWLGTAIGYANFVLGQTGLEKRKYPLHTRIACGIEERFEIALPPQAGAPVALPRYTPIDGPTLGFAHTLAISSNRLGGAGTFLLKAVEFTPAEYLQLKQSLRDIEYDLRQKVILREGAQPGGESDVLVLEDDTAIDVADARNWTVTLSARKRILTYAGKKENAELKFAYNPAWSEVTLERAAVTAPDGKVQEAVKEEINLMDAGWVGLAPRYPAEKILVVSLPGVEIGSVVESRVVQRWRDVPFFSWSRSFGGFEPAQQETLRVRAPEGLRLAVDDRTGGRVAREETTADGRRTLTWTARDIRPLTREEALPPTWDFVPTVFLSAGRWEDYAREVGGALRAAAAGQAAARARAARISGALADPARKAAAIRDEVARFVRGAGPGLNALPLSAVTPADTTLKEGYGNSADSAAVLYAMLEAAGLQPRFLLASSWSPAPGPLCAPLRDCPQRSLFDSVQVTVELDGRTVPLNDTDQYAQLGATPLDGQPALDLDGRPATVRALPDLEDRVESDYRIDLLENGDAFVTVTRRYFGEAFGQYHKRLAELPPEERRRYYQEQIAGLSQAAAKLGEVVTEYDYPGREVFSARIPRYGVRSADYLYLTLPGVADDFLRLRADRRENPLYRGEPLRRVSRWQVVLPASARGVLLAPEALAWDGPAGLGSVTMTTATRPGCAGDRVLELVQSVDLRQAVVPAADYASLLSLDRQLKHPRMRTLLLDMRAQP